MKGKDAKLSIDGKVIKPMDDVKFGSDPFQSDIEYRFMRFWTFVLLLNKTKGMGVHEMKPLVKQITTHVLGAAERRGFAVFK